MIDYRANVAALGEFHQALATKSITEPKIAGTRDEQIVSVEKAPDMALLGAMIDHLIWHAASDGAELLLVERAAELWKLGLILYQTIGEFRTGLEGALNDPTNPNAVQKFNEAMQKLHEFEVGVAGKEVEVAILRDDIYEAAHPHSHPRQQNKRLDHWTWADIFLARRTDAFARATWKLASDRPAKAFAFGVMSNYGANACGSAYLGQVVGGPRRAHRHRDRLARNAVGSWFALSYPGATSLAGIADRIRFGLFTPVLPTEVETLITDALTRTYDLTRTPPLPDLQLGYQRLLRHLDALDTFVMPQIPLMPSEPFLTRIYGDTANPSFSIMEAIIELQNAGGSGSGSGSGVTPQNLPQSNTVGQQDSRRNTKLDCGAFFMGLFQFIGTWAFFGGPCWEDWGNGKVCKLWEGSKHDFGEWWASLGGGQGAENTGTNSTLLTTASMSKEVTDLIHSLYDLHKHFWEALNSAYAYLSVCGLIYPDALLGRGVYRQFLTIPPPPIGGWPHLPVGDSAEQAHMYPSTSIEQPAVMTLPYPPGAKPGAFLTGVAAGGVVSAAHVSMAVWMQTAAHQLDANNYDLDADRGLFHPCWAADGSINDNPINVFIFDYSDT